LTDRIISGGNDPAIVFPDVDVEKVAEKVRMLQYQG
jgi:acyl-CoA reductase-like NAD-dependent aldehyde dehydrogenase